MVIPCLKLRNEIAVKIKNEVEVLAKKGVTPSFAIIQIGNEESSNVYIRVKAKRAQMLGIKTEVHHFNACRDAQLRVSTTQIEIENLIAKLNNNPSIHGIIIQRPFPTGFNETLLQSLIDPKKDIDGLSPNSPFQNPLVLAVNHALEFVLSQIPLRTTNYVLRTVIIGKGKSAGAPIYKYFTQNPIVAISPLVETRNCASLPEKQIALNIIQIDSKTKNPTEILKNADIIISCVGKDKIVNANNIKNGVVLISVGQHQTPSVIANLSLSKVKQSSKQIATSVPPTALPRNDKLKWTGDYNEAEIADTASAYTRTPGGIGPLNVIFLLQNVITSSQTL